VTDREWSRRKFLTVGGGTAILNGLFSFAGAETRRTKISDIQTMTISGARTYVFIKVVSEMDTSASPRHMPPQALE
jgi:hypothetical protein